MAFIVREATARTPLIPLRIFRSRNLSGANIVQPLLVAGMFGLFFMGALYMERVLGYDPLQIGFAFLPATLVMGTLSLRYSEPLITRFGAQDDAAPRAGADRRSAWRCSRARPWTAATSQHILPVMLVLAFGIGVSFPALMTLAMSGATQEDAGLASGLVNTTAQVGGALGLAVLATLSTTRTDNLLADGESNGAGARRRLSPRVLDRCRAGGAGLRDRGADAQARRQPGAHGGRGRRAPAGRGAIRSSLTPLL